MNLSLTDIEKELRELSNVNSTAWIQMYKLLTIECYLKKRHTKGK